MLVNKKIPVEIASAGFYRMKNSGSRLPWSEVEKMLKYVSWKNTLSKETNDL